MSLNRADYLTMSRFLMAIAAAHSLWYFTSLTAPLIFSIGVFFSDFMDGKIARLDSTASWRGALLDVTADFFYMVLMNYVLFRQGHIPIWVILILLYKYFEFVFSSMQISKFESSRRTVYDPFGKVLAVWFYISPIIIAAAFRYHQPIYFFLTREVLYLTFLAAMISSAVRFAMMINKKRAHWSERIRRQENGSF